MTQISCAFTTLCRQFCLAAAALLVLSHSLPAQTPKPNPPTQNLLSAATEVIKKNGLAVPAIGPVYKTMRPSDSGYFKDVCNLQLPPSANLPPVIGPPYPLPVIVTVDGTKYTISFIWCTTQQKNIPFPGTMALTPTLSEAHVKSATPVAYGTPVVTNLPNQPVTNGVTFLNCSSTAGTQSSTLAVALARSTMLTVTDSVATAESFTLNLSFGVPMVFSESGSVTIGQTTTTSTANAQGTTSTITKTEQVTVTVPPKSAVSAMISSYPIQYKISFATNVQVGGTFKTYQCAMTNPISCPKTIDDLYAQPPAPGKPRTTPSMFQLPIRGYLTSSDASNAVVTQYPATLPSDCSTGLAGMQKVPFRPKSK